MTSKRALVELIIEAESVNANEKRISFLSNEIEKDLEVLEILKKHLSIKNLTPCEYPQIIILSGSQITNIDEFYKIKEWLVK